MCDAFEFRITQCTIPKCFTHYCSEFLRRCMLDMTDDSGCGAGVCDTTFVIA